MRRTKEGMIECLRLCQQIWLRIREIFCRLINNVIKDWKFNDLLTMKVEKKTEMIW